MPLGVPCPNTLGLGFLFLFAGVKVLGKSNNGQYRITFQAIVGSLRSMRLGKARPSDCTIVRHQTYSMSCWSHA